MISKVLVALAFSTIFSCVSAQSDNSICNRVTGALDGLTLSSCSESDGVLVLKYLGAAPTSPYASDFDRRNFFIAFSNDSDALFKRIGMRSTAQNIFLVSTLLASPPEQDQILHRQVLKTKIQQDDWVVWLEEIQYSAQGQVGGYSEECGTAIRRQSSTHDVIAASECFAHEDMERFLKTLSKVEIPVLPSNVPASTSAVTPKQ